jgi:hypothetical protein
MSESWCRAVREAAFDEAGLRDGRVPVPVPAPELASLDFPKPNDIGFDITASKSLRWWHGATGMRLTGIDVMNTENCSA